MGGLCVYSMCLYTTRGAFVHPCRVLSNSRHLPARAPSHVFARAVGGAPAQSPPILLCRNTWVEIGGWHVVVATGARCCCMRSWRGWRGCWRGGCWCLGGGLALHQGRGGGCVVGSVGVRVAALASPFERSTQWRSGSLRVRPSVVERIGQWLGSRPAPLCRLTRYLSGV